MPTQNTYPEVIAWDLDGTIISGSEAVHHEANALVLFKLGIGKFGRNLPVEVRIEISGLSGEAVWNYFREQHNFKAPLDLVREAKLKQLKKSAESQAEGRAAHT
jgi:hypothetical protein